MKRLAAKPGDPAAKRDLDAWLDSPAGRRTDLPPEVNLGLGQYLIVQDNGWDDGLRRLVLSSAGPWRAAAELDLTAASSDDPPTWVDAAGDPLP